jgi:hypothetical protein
VRGCRRLRDHLIDTQSFTEDVVADKLAATQEVNVNDVERLPQGVLITFSDRRTFLFRHDALVELREEHARELVDELDDLSL